MNIILTLLLSLVVILSAAAREAAANTEPSGASQATSVPGDGETERSPNALLRGSLSAEGVYVESDSFYGGGGEEGHFEAGAAEFWKTCKKDGLGCTSAFQCCGGTCKCSSDNKCLATNKKCYTPTPRPTSRPSRPPTCREEGDRCDSTDECCGHFLCDNGRIGRGGGECRCMEESEQCDSTGECCNDMSCNHGRCEVCKKSGEECSDDRDCCSERCVSDDRRRDDDDNNGSPKYCR